MATFELKNRTMLPGPRFRLTGVLDRIRDFRNRRREIRAQRRAYFATLNELQSFSDRDLADIGVNRGDIHDIAMQAARMSRAKR